MAQRGRKPTPTALKLLEGNPGKRPLNTREPKREWKRMAKVLEQMGLLTEMDMARMFTPFYEKRSF